MKLFFSSKCSISYFMSIIIFKIIFSHLYTMLLIPFVLKTKNLIPFIGKTKALIRFVRKITKIKHNKKNKVNYTRQNFYMVYPNHLDLLEREIKFIYKLQKSKIKVFWPISIQNSIHSLSIFLWSSLTFLYFL